VNKERSAKVSEEFENYRVAHHQEAKDWKSKTGGKVLGTLCCNVPEEIIHAAGMLPVRLLGEHEPTTEADLHLPTNLCPYCKSWFDQLLKGKYDYLDGMVIPNVCNIIKASYGFSKYLLKLSYVHFVDIPQRISPEGVEFFAKNIMDFKKSIEDFSGKPISDKALRHSIDVYNENRTLLDKMYTLRKKYPSVLSGSEAQSVVISSMLMPKEEHNRLLSRLIKDMEKSDKALEKRVNLFISASILDDTDFFKLIEECGGNVVTDDMPMGSRYFYGLVDSKDEPLHALAERYLTKIACPRKMLPADRIAFSLGRMDGANINGTIIHSMRACDPHLYEYPLLRQEMERRGLPVLFFRGEETATEREQQKTDIESFIEMLKDR
jgi:benzoyl-CoA reductase subunit C